MRKLFLILMAVVACAWSAVAQNRTISGTVVDAANNEPLIGATVLPNGGGQGTATDIDGNFTLSVPSNVKTATITYIGYTAKTVELKNGMTVHLAAESTTLDDVVVVAYELCDAFKHRDLRAECRKEVSELCAVVCHIEGVAIDIGVAAKRRKFEKRSCKLQLDGVGLAVVGTCVRALADNHAECVVVVQFE